MSTEQKRLLTRREFYMSRDGLSHERFQLKSSVERQLQEIASCVQTKQLNIPTLEKMGQLLREVLILCHNSKRPRLHNTEEEEFRRAAGIGSSSPLAGPEGTSEMTLRRKDVTFNLPRNESAPQALSAGEKIMNGSDNDNFVHIQFDHTYALRLAHDKM